jgi:site-specific DNA recombinase
MMRNRAYLGELRFGRGADGEPAVITPGAFEPLVAEGVFDSVQAQLAERGHARTSPRRLGSDYLLSGLIRCGHCGAGFVGHPAKSGTVHYYGCQTKMKAGARECEAKLLNRNELERAVVDHLTTHVLEVSHLRSLLRSVNAELGTGTDELEGLRAVAAGQLREQKAQLDRFITAVGLGSLDPSLFADRMNDLKASTDRLQRDLDDLDDRIANAEPVVLTEHQLEAYVRGLATILRDRPVDERRAFLQAWIRRITATGRTIEIEYEIPGHPGTDGGLPATPTAGTGGRSTRSPGEHAARAVNKIRRVLASDKSGARTKTRTWDTRINSVRSCVFGGGG